MLPADLNRSPRRFTPASPLVIALVVPLAASCLLSVGPGHRAFARVFDTMPLEARIVLTERHREMEQRFGQLLIASFLQAQEDESEPAGTPPFFAALFPTAADAKLIAEVPTGANAADFLQLPPSTISIPPRSPRAPPPEASHVV